MKFLTFTALSLALSLSPLAAAPPAAKDGAKITKNEAQHIALKSRKDARVTAANLEKVDGKLVWSIEIAGGGGKRMTHVTIDAMSGRIVAASRAHR
jgi:uncharacterized membrane protein YkoI